MASDCVSVVLDITSKVIGVCKKHSITYQNKKSHAHLDEALKLLEAVDEIISQRERDIVLDLVRE